MDAKKMNVGPQRVFTGDVCFKCAGKFNIITDSFKRQKAVREAFGALPSNCVCSADGSYPCPFKK